MNNFLHLLVSLYHNILRKKVFFFLQLLDFYSTGIICILLQHNRRSVKKKILAVKWLISELCNFRF